MKIHLHLGVHKTATTYMQECLKKNIRSLNAGGVGYIPLMKFRALLGRDFMERKPGDFDIGQYLNDFFPQSRPNKIKCLIISDENILGHCGAFVKTGELFPHASNRLKHLRRLLKGHEITVFCGLRSYDTFIASSYCEGLRTTRKYVSFNDFLGRIKWSQIDWKFQLETFAAALAPDNVVVWQYEKFRSLRDDILKELAHGLTGLVPADAASGNTYSSYSQTAIQVLDAVSAVIGIESTGKIIRPVGEVLKKTDGFPDFDPWDEAQKTNLQNKYASDCASIPPAYWIQNKSQKAGDRRAALLTA